MILKHTIELRAGYGRIGDGTEILRDGKPFSVAYPPIPSLAEGDPSDPTFAMWRAWPRGGGAFHLLPTLAAVIEWADQ